MGRVLKLAADQADCALHAAIVHISEEGTASYPDGDYYDGWYGRGSDHDDAEFDEVMDGHYWLDSWTGVDGEHPEFGEIALNPKELLPAGALDDAVPDEEWVNESSGNEGVTVERAYRHAAFAIWPGPRTLDVLTAENIVRAVAWVKSRLQRDSASGRELLARLIDAWPDTLQHSNGLRNDAQARCEVLELLAKAGDPALAARFLRDVVRARFDGSETGRLPAVLALTAPGDAAAILAGLVRLRFSRWPGAVLALLMRVNEMPESAHRDMLCESIRAAVAALPEAMSAQAERGATTWPPRERRETVSHILQIVERDPALDFPARSEDARRREVGDEAIRDLLVLTWRYDLTEEAEAAAATIEAFPETATPERTVPASLKALSAEEGLGGSSVYRSLWRHATGALLRRSDRPPEEPRNWIVPADLDCDCAPCARLDAFCNDPDAQIGRLPFRKELRRHLHRQIDRHRLDMSHVTERRGSPYTLVCTKNRASHERRLAEYAEDVDWMLTLARIAPPDAAGESTADRLRRLAEAIGAAG